MERIFLMSFHIAGFSYYEGAFVFKELSIGDPLELVLDEKNLHDENAVEIRFKGRKIGYVPRSLNKEIARIMKAGYNIFEAVVQQISAGEHPEEQVRVGVFIIPAKPTKKKKK